MLGSMPRNVEKEQKSFSWAQGHMPRGARCIEKD
jgi:hypothetical protein